MFPVTKALELISETQFPAKANGGADGVKAEENQGPRLFGVSIAINHVRREDEQRVESTENQRGQKKSRSRC